ncbi:MAG: cytochrome c [Desulfobacteraceae bacterium]|nr:cytochrome c [Desulfobacteraceae bacterium]
MKTAIYITVCFVVLLFGLTVIYAGNVLDQGMRSPLQIVKTRKFIMHLFAENLQDMNKKMEGKQIKNSKVNAGNISVTAAMLPPLYRGVHKQVYTSIKDAHYFFKGQPGPAMKIQAEKLSTAADLFRKGLQTGDTTQVKKYMNNIQSSCKECHGIYRGKL